MAREQVNTTVPQRAKRAAAEQVYENVVTTSTEQTSKGGDAKCIPLIHNAFVLPFSVLSTVHSLIIYVIMLMHCP